MPVRRSDDHAESVLASRLRERMEALGLNPFSVAKKAGVGQDTVRDILRGRVKQPSADRLAKLAQVLECSIYYLLGKEEIEVKTQRFGRDTYEPEPPAPLPAAPENLNKQASLLPIRFELMADAFRKANDVARQPIGYEAATIPHIYRHRASWWELVRDDSMNEVAPAGSLVQVVEMNDDERHLINDGDVVVITKRLYTSDVSINLVERSLRRISYTYPEYGLWFMNFASSSPEWPELNDEIFRETEPTAPRDTKRDLVAEAAEDNWELASILQQRETQLDALEAQSEDKHPLADAVDEALRKERIQRALDRMSDPKYVSDTLREIDEHRRKFGHKLVGKVIRVLTSASADAPLVRGT